MNINAAISVLRHLSLTRWSVREKSGKRGRKNRYWLSMNSYLIIVTRLTLITDFLESTLGSGKAARLLSATLQPSDVYPPWRIYHSTELNCWPFFSAFLHPSRSLYREENVRLVNVTLFVWLLTDVTDSRINYGEGKKKYFLFSW